MVSTTLSGSTRGRKDSVWGQIGTKSSPETPGWTMDPPAASEYAVLPVGVDTMTPSARTLVIGLPSMLTSRSMRVELAPRSMTTSFSTMCRWCSSVPSARTTCATSRLLCVKKKSPFTTSSIALGMLSSSNAVRNPSEPMANEITGGTALGNRVETHRMVPSPPRHTIKSMILSRCGSSSCCHVAPSPVSQCTAGSTQDLIPFWRKISTTWGNTAVVPLSFGFFMMSTFFGVSRQENCECGTPCRRLRMARPGGSCTSHPSSLHSSN
mmetsp:Transcript_15090/g.37077  ORF Transcript_15090/g.37077 Transcript_15090/m.37077 type:complete len:267 (-) Transcript_15090:752-1552(-)